MAITEECPGVLVTSPTDDSTFGITKKRIHHAALDALAAIFTAMPKEAHSVEVTRYVLNEAIKMLDGMELVLSETNRTSADEPPTD